MSQTFAQNNRAKFDYEVLETFEAGIVLKGHEVKSIKTGKMALAGSRVIIRGGEAFLIGSQIPAYQPNNVPADYDPTAVKKLLVSKDEISKFIGALKEGVALIPLRAYLKNNLIKIEVALARGRKKHDKRELLKKRDARREMKSGI